MRWSAVAIALALAACGGDDRPGVPPPDGLTIEAAVDGAQDLFGEPCTQPEAPQVGICHEGEGGCHDEPGGSVCRPWCHVDGVPQCEARGGVDTTTDRGACVCTPP